LLTYTLAQAVTREPVAVVQSSRRPGAEAQAPKISQRVVDSLRREGVGELLEVARAAKELRALGFSDPRTCQGTQACLAKLAVLLGPHAIVVGVDVGRVGKTLAIHLDAVAADQEAPLASLDVSSSLDGWSDAMSAQIVVFARDVKAGLVIKRAVDVPPPLPPPDAPVTQQLLPPPSLGPAHPSPQLTARAPRVGAFVLGGGALASAIAAVTFGLLGLGAKAQYEGALVRLPDGTFASSLTQARANQLASTANTDFTVALSTAILAAALGGAATWFFVRDEPR
jgi:hypothetical protein